MIATLRLISPVVRLIKFIHIYAQICDISKNIPGIS